MVDAIANAIRSAWEEGCPLAGGDVEPIAVFADRRLRSFERRAEKSRARLARIDDLGKGLAQHLGTSSDWSTPLKEDLRYLATKIVDAADAASM